METHPIPQQISSYQFRLVGDMTLKQFFQIAGGALISLLFYASNLHPLIKWPFIFFFSLLGVALAFLPFNERPLEKWIIAFFRSVYSPTLFSWKKVGTNPVFFQEEVTPLAEKIIAPKEEEAMRAYLTVNPTQPSSVFSGLEKAEQSFLSKIFLLFGSGVATPKQTVTAPKTTEPETQTTFPQIETSLKESQFVQQGIRPKLVVEEKTTPTQEVKLTNVTPTLTRQDTLATQRAQFSLEAAPPNPPSIPNTITGQVIDIQGKIIEAAILEIRDSAGRPVRALRSNKVGHFLVVTPLQNGKYEIITEKDGFSFTPVTFEAQGEIIPPIAIKGRLEPKIVVTEEASQPINQMTN
jgi:hypothetical protein